MYNFDYFICSGSTRVERQQAVPWEQEVHCAVGSVSAAHRGPLSETTHLVSGCAADTVR
jgi:hypothetical protein